jgi:hypothetical protein
MCKEWSVSSGNKKGIQDFGWNARQQDHLGHLLVDWRIILKSSKMGFEGAQWIKMAHDKI